ncbi:LuxR C-terminal-related transcriptional regulator [Streptomyces sp. NPDC005780]|uniref:LuxR C-terminal-related transcriptional regulator n=1 Tax=Streptomyces sp. NPDC005780 TaxID=3364730 RepID=UPI0036D1A371
MTPPSTHPHSGRELCRAGVALYTEALTAGRIARTALTAAPCLADLGLLHPDPRDGGWFRPVPPSTALGRLLQPLSREIDERIRLTATLSSSLAPLAAMAVEDPNLSITVIEGEELIVRSLQRASESARKEVLTAQPGGNRMVHNMRQGLKNARSVLASGGRLRHLYQHPARYSPHLKDYLAELPTDRLQIRTSEQVVDRLLIFDRKVAYLPARPDRSAALEIRHPALVAFLAGIYETLWIRATPFTQQLPTTVPGTPVTAVQQSIARLLIEGNQDEAVARTLGISVRTCRAHISKLMQTLDATSRTHLGALLVRSGIAEPAASRTTEEPAAPRTTEEPATPDVPG